jgi:quinol monooxygenase YgiN
MVTHTSKLKEILQSVRPLLAPTRVLSGCVSISFYQNIENPNVLSLVEEWQSQADLDYHLCSDEFKRLLSVMEMSSRKPEIRFMTISRTAGLEAVEAAWELPEQLYQLD